MKTILLLSGGMDSALCLHRHRPSLTIGYDYGQRALIELEYAQRLARWEEVPFELVRLPELPLIGAGALVRAGRNAVMLAHAAAVAQARGMDSVMIGCNASDAERFPDCRPLFIDGMNRALSFYGVVALAPLINTTKQEIIAACHEARITETWSCYTPKDNQPCGECYACEQRRGA